MSGQPGMPCPNCRTTALVMSDRQGIEIDYCPQCRGVWLDRGELDKIIERSNQQMAPAQAPQAPAQAPQAHQPYPPQAPYPQQTYADPRAKSGYDPRYPYPKRRKSFLEELFD